MKRPFRVLLRTLMMILAVLVIATCSVPGKYEFSGTWSDFLGLIGTWTFGDASGSYSNKLLIVYTISFDYTTVDEAANHILVNITSVTGPGAGSAGVTAGFPAYITYSVSGNNLYADISASTYPSSATSGPFTK